MLLKFKLVKRKVDERMERQKTPSGNVRWEWIYSGCTRVYL